MSIDDFTMIDILPADKVDIRTLYTGSFNEDVPIKVYVRTTSWKDPGTSVSGNFVKNGKSSTVSGNGTSDTYVFSTGEHAWKNGTTGSLTFTAKASPDKFKKVTVDDKDVADGSWERVPSEDETSVLLHSNFLNRLSAGEHTVTFIFEDGTASTTLTIGGTDSIDVSKGSADTGSDGWILWADGISSGKGAVLSKDALKLKDGERIAQIKIEYGTVQPGFINNMEDKPYYEGPVDDLAVGTEILNHISLTGTAFGKKLKDEDDTTTTTTVPDEKIDVEKSAPETAKAGESIQYTIDVVKNGTSYTASNFTLHDTLPENVYMTSLYTGTYSDQVSMTVLYKTNLSSDWKIWKKDVSSSKAETLKADSLKLQAKEYITEFAIEYGTVPAGFSATKDVPNYYVTIGSREVSKEYVNNIELSAYVKGKKLTDSDQTKTIIPDEPKGVKTGDDNNMLIFFIVLFALALTGTVAYTVFSVIRKRHSVTVVDLGDSIRVEPKKAVKKLPKEPLSELLKK